MDDGLTIALVFLAIPILAIAFVWILRREDQARVTAGSNRIFALGYRTKLGWVMAIGLAIVTYVIWSRI